NWPQPSPPYSTPVTLPFTPFQPAPYVPSAKMPNASTPNEPHTTCTEIAPHGSSTCMRSQNDTLTTTSQPAIAPITTAAQGATNAHDAVMATSPGSMPLHDIDTSGLPYLWFVTAIAITNPIDAASNVLTAPMPMRESSADKVEPGLKPIQP